MNKYERLVEKLKNREKVVSTLMQMFRSTIILEKMNRDDLDFITLDGEHGVFDTHNSIEMLQVCRLMGLPVLMRVQDSKYHLIAKVIDMGADGIILPRTESLEQLRTAVDAMFFAPDGKKGVGGHGQLRNGEKRENFGKTRFLMPQIESVKGIEILPKMIEEYGQYISAVLVGPYDLSVMLGKPCEITNEVVIKSIQQIFDICNSYGKSCGIFCDDEVFAQKYRKMGCNVLWTGVDSAFLLRGYNEEMDVLASIE